MKQMSSLTEAEEVLVSGGGVGDDSLARDFGQYVGGFYSYLFQHPFLSNLPIFGQFLPNVAGIGAATR
jgi:hypothetical protein